MGSDAWGSAELFNLCGKDCVDQFFSTHYTAEGATGKTKEFIDKYKAKYGYVPDDVAALTWDSINIVLQAIQKAGKIDPDLKKERKIIRDNMSEFTRALGKACGRPSWLPVPAAILRLMLGQMADELLLAGQNPVPARLQAAGYAFHQPDLESALRSVLR